MQYKCKSKLFLLESADALLQIIAFKSCLNYRNYETNFLSWIFHVN